MTALHGALPGVFLALIIVMWVWYFVFRALRRRGFEIDTLAFFLSTLGLIVTASANLSGLLKQFCAMLIGLLIFISLGWYMRDLERVKKTALAGRNCNSGPFGSHACFWRNALWCKKLD